MPDPLPRQNDAPGRAWFLGTELGAVKPCDEPDGWPEFEITVRFYVSSDDPAPRSCPMPHRETHSRGGNGG